MLLFASRLKETRESRNVSAVELAEAISVDKGTIYRYEKADFKSIKESRLQAIADYLKVDKSYLTGEVDDKYHNITLKTIITKEDKDIDKFMTDVVDYLTNDGIVIEGKQASKSTVDALISYLELGIQLAKRKNKEE